MKSPWPEAENLRAGKMIKAQDLFFSWENLGNIEVGRPNLGPMVPVLVYRLMQYTMRTVLEEEFGSSAAREIFVAAGRLAGREFCHQLLDTGLELPRFLAQLQQTLIDLKIGILRVEEFDETTLDMTLTVAEDLDCSGLPITDETVCDYDEGFLAGIFEVYFQRPFTAKEIDCWATGSRVCRFKVRLAEAPA